MLLWGHFNYFSLFSCCCLCSPAFNYTSGSCDGEPGGVRVSQQGSTEGKGKDRREGKRKALGFCSGYFLCSYCWVKSKSEDIKSRSAEKWGGLRECWSQNENQCAKEQRKERRMKWGRMWVEKKRAKLEEAWNKRKVGGKEGGKLEGETAERKGPSRDFNSLLLRRTEESLGHTVDPPPASLPAL